MNIAVLRNKTPWRLAVIFICIMAGIVAGGVFFYHQQRVKLALEKQSDLDAIATLKVRQIESWRKERYGDAVVIARSGLFVRDAGSWIRNPENAAAAAHVRNRLEAMKVYDSYQSMFLADPDGGVRLVIGQQHAPQLGAATIALLRQAGAQRVVMFSDFYRCDLDGQVHLDLLSPLVENGKTVAVVILRIDPQKLLFPLIQSWPAPSRSSETLIVRRDGDSVLFLNDLRFAKDAALELRRPLSDSLLPASMAALGKEGMVEGRDYRGIKVLAAIKHIPDSPWYMVAKVDADEVYAPVRRLSAMIIFAVLALIALAGLAAGLHWQRTQKDLYRDLHRAETERKALVSHFEYVIKNANDIILLADENQRIMEVNDRALSTYGYTREELYGKPVAIIRPRTLWADFDSQLQDLRASGDSIYETIHRRKNGDEFPVEVSARFIDLEGKKYFQGIVRDISERKKAQAEIAARNRSLELLHQCALDLASLPHGKDLPDVLTDWLKKLTGGYAVTFGEYDRDKKEIVLKRILLEPGALARLETAVGRSLMDVRSPVSPETYRLMMAEQVGTRQTLHEVTFGAIQKIVSTTVGVMLGIEKYIAIVYQTGGTMYATSVIALKKGQPVPDTATLKAFAALGAVSLRRAAAEDKLQAAHEELQASYQEIEANNQQLTANNEMLMAAEEELRQKNEELTASEEELKANEEELEQQLAELQLSQEKLRVSETSYRRLFEAAKDGILILNAGTGVIEDANPFIKELLGYPREELIGKELWQIGLFKDIVASRDSFIELKNKGYVRYEDMPLQTKDGRKKEVEFVSNVYPVGDHHMVQCNIRDITARKLAEQALRESERQLREAQQMAQLGHWSWDIKTGAVEWSDEVYKIFQLDPKTFTPQIDSILALSPWPEDHQRDQELIRRAMETREKGEYEQRFLRPDQSIGYYQSTFQGRYDAAGNLVTIIGTVMDVTERKQAEVTVRQSEERLRRFVDANIIGVVIADASGRIIEANDYYLGMIGYSRAEFDQGLVNWRTITPPEWLPADEKAIAELNQQGACAPYEKEYLRRDGSRVTVYLTDAILPGPEKLIVAFALDVTQRKRAEEQIKKQLDELQRWQSSMLDREDRVQELKREINDLLAKLGKEPKYHAT